ncbi:inositol monophosphatase [Roseospira marina]|uniref:Inositol-1-monophosphatase n=1 Tax=Roseospira marina TaxID=140057 RepID=A0A5M6IHK3_9PROT|nr:inositol monophosphatase family protein [Roseospira marina]KAA5607269.1 inositol monophosphatase [Roseospira marina]MBB4312578.1 myo-inositol-1(or 4)-monophosphatase [Roseospira marina]MBB5085406.1 myo-inositol-1(or 4)-monophosphatase [Roseospira marina]
MAGFRSANINVMVAAANKAARGLVRDFGEVEQLQVSVKGPGDFVSNADMKAERVIKAELKKARPDWGFLMEESGADEGRDSRFRWIVDPLDGTTNFLHGIPHFAISIGLEREGEIIAGVVLNPITDELYWAEKGQGAFVNDRRLRVSARRDLSASLFATGIPFKGRPGHAAFLRQAAQVMAVSAGLRRMGVASLDLAFTAAGRFDGFWESGLHPWDIAAGIILVREAGGNVTDLKGNADPLKTGTILAANQPLHATLMDLVGPKAEPPAARAQTADTPASTGS